MKRSFIARQAAVLAALLVTMLAAGTALAQEISVSGELRTGLYMQQETQKGRDPETIARGGMTNTDGDSGGGTGRARLNILFTYQNLGLRASFQLEPPQHDKAGPMSTYLTWNYVYAYGNLINEQLTISAGILGGSPWGTGGPELKRDPETREYQDKNNLTGDNLSADYFIATEGLMGIRFEFKPTFIDALKGLNVGFTLSQPDQVAGDIKDNTLIDALSETVIGAAYEHDLFAVRVGYRFDGAADKYKETNTEEGGRLGYRLEERALKNIIPGMQVWLNGYYYGIGNGKREPDKTKGILGLNSGEYFDNWLYWLWDADSFLAKLDVRFAMYKDYENSYFFPERRLKYNSLEFRPAFYYKLFNNMLQVGLRVGFGIETGNGKTESPYKYLFIEPQVRFNMSANAYLALVYIYTDKYNYIEDKTLPKEESKKHAINLRAVYTF